MKKEKIIKKAVDTVQDNSVPMADEMKPTHNTEDDDDETLMGNGNDDDLELETGQTVTDMYHDGEMVMESRVFGSKKSKRNQASDSDTLMGKEEDVT